MFTGLISDIGRVSAVEQKGDRHLTIACNYPAEKLAIGASVACNGVCLTVTERGASAGKTWFKVVASKETTDVTNLADWQVGSLVNLEQALKIGDELGGHLVMGHVDCVTTLTDIRQEGESLRLQFYLPPDFRPYIAPKGSIVLNGTSLTVNAVEAEEFGVNIIPHTADHTSFGIAKIGDRINLEIDALARYIGQLLANGFMPRQS